MVGPQTLSLTTIFSARGNYPAGSLITLGNNVGVPHPLLAQLTTAAAQYAPQHEPVVYTHTFPAEPGVSSPWPSWVAPEVVEGFLGAQGVVKPWQHQVQAWEVLDSGRHLALATATGSGKSLIAWAPALTAALSPPSGRVSQVSRPATALYVSPTKALGNDQADKLDQVLKAGGILSVQASVVDGDTPLAERSWARGHADIVFTNPDFLHYSLLPRAARWSRLLRGLRYIFVDELHSYRGMVGAHVSLVVRRLLRLAHAAGAVPQVIVASATASTPGPTVATFLGVDLDQVGVVDRSTAPQGRRTIALWDPPDSGSGEAAAPPMPPQYGYEPHTEEKPTKKSALVEASDLLSTLVMNHAATLVFTRARAAAEAVAEMVRERLPRELHSRIAAYRGGYLPEERRAIERDLHNRDLLGVATTNALEMGIDISGLDAVLITGWPGTRASFWQQVGRTGRAGTDGLAVLIASEDPLDHYLLSHPEHVFSAPVEATVFDPTNPNVLAPHLCAAAAESPLTLDDLPLFSLPDTALLDELVARGLLRRRPRGWFWNYDRPEAPATLTDLRGGIGPGVSVVEHGTGRVVGTVDADRADATVHPGAVYLHQGRTYSVIENEDDVAVVVETTEPFRTRAFSRTRIEILSVEKSFTAGEVAWNYGKVEVRSQVVGFQQRRIPSLEVVSTYGLEMPERTLRTSAVWWTVPAQALLACGVEEGNIPGALHAAEHALIALLGLVATCDRWDLGGLSTAIHERTLAPTVFVHDAFPGGAGFAHRGFDAASTWVESTYQAVSECPCDSGCPRCIQSPKCGNGNNPLDKHGAILTLRLLRDSFTTADPPARSR